MQTLVPFEISSWEAPVSDEDLRRAADALESGGVLYFPRLAFELDPRRQTVEAKVLLRVTITEPTVLRA